MSRSKGELQLPPYSQHQIPRDDSLGLRRRLQILESENRNLMSSQGAIIQETNRRVQTHMNEIKLLKDENAKLSKENSELRDLCCFLDDDRERTKRLSREWQRFGRYTSGVMKQEVATYQTKLQDLEQQQKALIEENNEMKQLCLFLDDQRKGLRNNDPTGPGTNYPPGIITPSDAIPQLVSCPKCEFTFTNHGSKVSSENGQPEDRLDGDGSSGRSSDSEQLNSPKSNRQTDVSTPDDSKPRKQLRVQFAESSDHEHSPTPEPSFDNNNETIMSDIEAKEKSLKEETLIAYIRSLESRVQQLEEKKRMELSQSTPHLASVSPMPASTHISQSSQDITVVHLGPDPLTVSQESGKSFGTSTVYGSEDEEGIDSKTEEEDEIELSQDDSEGSSYEDEEGSTLTPIEEETDESDSAMSIPFFRRPALRGKNSGSHHVSISESLNLSTDSTTSFCGEEKSKAGGPAVSSSISVSSTMLEKELHIYPNDETRYKSHSDLSITADEVDQPANSSRGQNDGSISRSEEPIVHQMCKVVWKTLDSQTTNSRDFDVMGTTGANTSTTVL